MAQYFWRELYLRYTKYKNTYYWEKKYVFEMSKYSSLLIKIWINIDNNVFVRNFLAINDLIHVFIGFNICIHHYLRSIRYNAYIYW